MLDIFYITPKVWTKFEDFLIFNNISNLLFWVNISRTFIFIPLSVIINLYINIMLQPWVKIKDFFNISKLLLFF